MVSRRTARDRRVRRVGIAAYGILAVGIIAVLALAVLASVRAPNPLTIEADQSEPAILEVSQSLQRSLAEAGFEVQILDNGDEDIVVEKVQDAADQRGVDLGVTARAVNSRQFPNVVSLGVVAKIPLIIVARGPNGTFESPADLVGSRIQIGDFASVSADVARRLLAEYGVTADNSTLQRDSLDVAEQMLEDGLSDAVVLLYSPKNQSLEDLVTQEDFSIVPMPATKALAGRLGDVDVGVLPKGSYSITADSPSEDMDVVLVPITAVANDSISTGAVYAMAQGLKEDFGPADVLSAPGEFPQASSNLPNHPDAESYYQTSSIPWQYRQLPPTLADLFIPLALAGTIFLIAASIYQVLLPEFYSLWTGVLRPRRERRREHRHARRAERADRRHGGEPPA